VSLAQVWSLPWPLAVALGLGGLALWGWTQRGAQAAHAEQAAQTTQPARAAQAPADPTPAPTVHPASAEGLPAAASAGGAALQAAAPTPSESESFAYTVSHDLRAPIRVIEGFTRIVREDYGHLLDRVGNDHLDRVLGAAARMNHMIDALLALARLSSQPLARQRVDLSRLAQHVLDDLCKHTPQRRIEWRVMPELSTQGDPTLLRLVLENLLGNAWKYSARRDVAQIEFGCAPQGDRQVYFISDNGAGFDMRFADRLFGPFQRLHSAAEFQGTGVGLASVQRIVRRHGGEIWAEAEVDRGATFYFTLG
jgi:light-regulated signal transduction histidine kinase (bacteriophytochrome)